MEEEEKKPKKKYVKIEGMRINHHHRKKLKFFLDNFYSHFPHEQFTIFHFVRYFKTRLKNDKDAWVGVSGDTGVGKSYFTIMAMILFGRPMTMQENIAYIPKGEEIIQKFKKLNFNCLLIDEAARQMRKVNWQNKQQQLVNLAAMTDRFKNNMVFLNLPNFDEFTKSMRTGSLIFRAIIPYRTKNFARIIIQRKSRNWRSDDPWGDIKANAYYKSLEKKKKGISNDDILKIERSLSNTVMDFIIPDLALALPKISDEYERLKSESREDSDLSIDGKPKENVFKSQYQILMNKVTKMIFFNELDFGKRKIPKKEMAKSLGVSIDTFNKYLNSPRLENPLDQKRNTEIASIKHE